MLLLLACFALFGWSSVPGGGSADVVWVGPSDGHAVMVAVGGSFWVVLDPCGNVARLGTAPGAVVLSAARVPGSCLDLEGLPFGELGKGD